MNILRTAIANVMLCGMNIFYRSFCFIKKFFSPFHWEERLFFSYIRNRPFQRVVFCLKCLFWFFLCVRLSFLLLDTLSIMFSFQNTVFGILPSELALLDHYLAQPDQDPEWVEFVRQQAQNRQLSPREYEVMVRDFLNTELCSSTREQICSLYKLIFFGREDPKFFIDPVDLDLILHVHLENISFDHAALCQVLTSLGTEGEGSAFFSEVKASQAGHFQGFLALKAKNDIELQEREELYRETMELHNKMNFIRDENASIRRRITYKFI